MAPLTKRMWPGGPLRQFSDKPFHGSIPVVGGYAGGYVCDCCGAITKGGRYSEATEGVRIAPSEKDLELAWVCAYCEATSVEIERAHLAYTSKGGPENQYAVT